MEHRKRSSPPRDMPAEAPRPRKGTLHGRQKPDDPLPEQQPVTDDEPAPKKPSRLRLILLRVAVGVLLVIALVFAYLFLLLGEPDEEAKYVDLPDEELITMPMGALEIPGEANLQNLANTFGQPVMALYGGPALERARVYDTAFGGGYARRVTLTYAFDDGTQTSRWRASVPRPPLPCWAAATVSASVRSTRWAGWTRRAWMAAARSASSARAIPPLMRCCVLRDMKAT